MRTNLRTKELKLGTQQLGLLPAAFALVVEFVEYQTIHRTHQEEEHDGEHRKSKRRIGACQDGKPVDKDKVLNVIKTGNQPYNPHHIETPFAPCEQPRIEIKSIKVKEADMEDISQREEVAANWPDLSVEFFRTLKEKGQHQDCAPDEYVKRNRDVS